MTVDPERVRLIVRHLAGRRVCHTCAEVFLEILDDVRAGRDGGHLPPSEPADGGDASRP